MLLSCDSVDRLVENLPTQHSALQLRPQQAALSLGSLHEAAVLLSTSRQIRYDLVDGAIWNVFVDGETGLTCFSIGAQGHKFKSQCPLSHFAAKYKFKYKMMTVTHTIFV